MKHVAAGAHLPTPWLFVPLNKSRVKFISLLNRRLALYDGRGLQRFELTPGKFWKLNEQLFFQAVVGSIVWCPVSRRLYRLVSRQ